MVHTQHHKAQRKKQGGKGKKDPGRQDNGNNSNQGARIMEPDHPGKGRGKNPKKATEGLKGKGAPKNQEREAGKGVRREKERNGKMAGKEGPHAKKGKDGKNREQGRKKDHHPPPRIFPVRKQFPRFKLTAKNTRNLSRPHKPAPEGKEEAEGVKRTPRKKSATTEYALCLTPTSLRRTMEGGIHNAARAEATSLYHFLCRRTAYQWESRIQRARLREVAWNQEIRAQIWPRGVTEQPRLYFEEGDTRHFLDVEVVTDSTEAMARYS
jgi:hypothetical protein